MLHQVKWADIDDVFNSIFHIETQDVYTMQVPE